MVWCRSISSPQRLSAISYFVIVIISLVFGLAGYVQFEFCLDLKATLCRKHLSIFRTKNVSAVFHACLKRSYRIHTLSLRFNAFRVFQRAKRLLSKISTGFSGARCEYIRCYKKTFPKVVTVVDPKYLRYINFNIYFK